MIRTSMMNYTYRYAIFLLVVSMLGSAAWAGDNLISNGDFERESPDSPPPGWSMWGPARFKNPRHFRRDFDVKHKGKASLRLEHPKNTDGYLSTNPDSAVQAKHGQSYSVSFYARADKAGKARFGIWSYSDLKKMTDAPSPGYWGIEVTTKWKRYEFAFREGVEFFVSKSPYLFLNFKATSNDKEERVLWLDDIVMTAKSNPPGTVRLDDPATFSVEPLQHRLTKGNSLNITADCSRVLHKTTRLGGGVSFHRVSGHTGTPYDHQGRYTLDPQLETAIADLKLPMTRFYGVADETYSVEKSLDKIAALAKRVKLNPKCIVIELEDQYSHKKLPPAVWAAAVQYAKERNYGFRDWEIGNEVYASAWGHTNVAFKTPDEYVAHVKAVSKAIKAVDPDARIGLSIAGDSTRWRDYVIAAAAGYYDFVCPHLYAMPDVFSTPFEKLSITENYKVLDRAMKLRALLHHYNKDRKVTIYDTEWALHGYGKKGEVPDEIFRNANIVGVMHRAVRMIYYAREQIVEGASAWSLLVRGKKPGFGILISDDPKQRPLLYWLYYYYARHLGDNVLPIQGTTPYLAGNEPLVPAVVTASADKKTIYLIAANASWVKSVPCTLRLSGAAPEKVKVLALSQNDRDASPLLASREQAVRELPAEINNGEINMNIPPHAVIFATIKCKPKEKE